MPSLDQINLPFFIAGVVLCLCGWLLYWLALHVTGGFFGAAVGIGASWLATVFFHLESMQMWIVILSGVAGFALGIFLIRGVHRFAFFLMGATAGLVTGQLFFNWGRDKLDWIASDVVIWQGVLLIVPSLIGGVMMVFASRWIVALVTSIAGTVLIFHSIPETVPVIAIIPVVLVSFFLQVGLLGRLMPKRRAEAAEEDLEEEEEEEPPPPRRKRR